MIFNIILILFLLAMIYWWAMQGLLSSLLHLVMVITAGGLALALWEPITHGLLLNFKPPVAWAVGLVVPFVLLLMGLRYAADKLVPDNLHFMHAVDMLGGAAGGLLSGILTAGIFTIAIGFLPMGPSIAGYQPYGLGPFGQVQETDAGLWLPVEHWTAGFYEFLAGDPGWAGGAFTSSAALGHYQPEIARQAALVRLRPDPLSAVAASPDALERGKVYAQPWPEVPEPAKSTLGESPVAPTANDRLVMVETDWKQRSGVYDPDSKLRVPPTQIRLVTSDKQGRIKLRAPVAFVRPDPTEDGQRFFDPFNEPDEVAFGVTPSETLAWVFVLPQDTTAKHLLVRHLRLDLPEPEQYETEPEAVEKALGKLHPEPEADDEGEQDEQAEDQDQPSDTAGNRSPQGKPWIVATDALPGDPLNRNELRLSVSGDAITGGKQEVGPGGYVNPDLQVTRINNATVRLKFSTQRKETIFGPGALGLANQTRLIRIEDTAGNLYFPVAYVVVQKNDGRLIHVKGSNDPFRRVGELPRVGDDEQLYLYFTITPGVSLAQFQYKANESELLNDWEVPEPPDQQ